MQSTWEDPPEYRERGGGGGGMQGMPQLALPPLTPAVRFLLKANVGAFLLFWILGVVLDLEVIRTFENRILALNPVVWRTAFERWFVVPIWQVVTYGFLHDIYSLGHILGNMLLLYFFGTMLESTIGTRRFAVVYGAALVLGGTVQILINLVSGSPYPTVGASGAVLGVLVAMAVLRPNQTVIALFIPITLKWLAVIVVGADVFYLLSRIETGTAVAVHLTGAGFGFLTARMGWIFLDPFEAWARRRDEVRAEKMVLDESRLDELLERIHREGMTTLSRREKEFLKRVSARRDSE